MKKESDCGTANPAGEGVYKHGSFEMHEHPASGTSYGFTNPSSTQSPAVVVGNFGSGSFGGRAAGVAKEGGAETAPDHTRVAAVILI